MNVEIKGVMELGSLVSQLPVTVRDPPASTPLTTVLLSPPPGDIEHHAGIDAACTIMKVKTGDVVGGCAGLRGLSQYRSPIEAEHVDGVAQGCW